MMQQQARVACCVPFCRRTRKPDGYPEWICGKHWRMVRKRTRTRMKLMNRIVRREIRRNPLVSTYWKMKPGSRERISALRTFGLMVAVWQRCKREAIERAAGL